MPGRMSVRAATPGTNPNWFVFALSNPDRQADRALAHGRPLQRGRLRRGLARPRCAPHRRGDAFGRLRARAHQERSRRRVPHHARARPDRHLRRRARRPTASPASICGSRSSTSRRARDRQLLQRHHARHHRPAGDLPDRRVRRQPQGHLPARPPCFTWCVLAYLCVDFGFWHKLFQVRPEENAHYRAAHRGGDGGELRDLPLHVPAARRLARLRAHAARGCGSSAQLALVAVAFIDPRLAATFARLSFVGIAGVGAAADAVPGAARPGPRAVAGADLDAAAGVAVRRRRHLDRPAVRRHRRFRPDGGAGADRRADRLHRHAVSPSARSSRSTAPQPGEQQLRSLAVDGAGAAVWEWNARRDEIKVSADRRGDARPQGRASCRARSTTSQAHAPAPTASASSCCCGR